MGGNDSGDVGEAWQIFRFIDWESYGGPAACSWELLLGSLACSCCGQQKRQVPGEQRSCVEEQKRFCSHGATEAVWVCVLSQWVARLNPLQNGSRTGISSWA